MVTLVDAEDIFDTIQHPYMIKILNQVGIVRKYLNTIKCISDKPTTNVIFNGES